MKIKSIKLLNWGPYFGEHFIDLSVDASAPVVVFYAENGRGKTTILNGIKWCLYGKPMFRNDGRTEKPLESIINKDALNEGELVDFEVTLVLQHKDEELELSRYGKARSTPDGEVTITSRGESLKPINGVPFAAQDIPDQINNLLNFEVSDFFLFDGEMLGRFEDKLRESDNSRKFVKKQVERALGLPFMQMLIGDLDEIEDQTNKRIEAASKRNNKTQQTRDKLKELQDDMLSIDTDIEELSGKVDEAQKKVDEFQELLDKYEPIRDLLIQQVELEKSRDRYQSSLDDIRVELKEVVESKWWFPLQSELLEEYENLSAQWQEVQANTSQKNELTYKLNMLRDQLLSKNCLQCGQVLPKDDETHVHTQIQELEAEIDGLGDEQDRSDVLGRLTLLRPFSNYDPKARISDLEKDLLRTKTWVDRDEQALRDISEQIQSGDNIDIRALESQRNDWKLRLKEAANLLERTESAKGTLKGRLSALSKELRDTPEVDIRDIRLVELAEEVEEVIRVAFTDFSEEMRRNVEEHASRLFHTLSEETEYDTVKIGPDYTLEVTSSKYSGNNSSVDLSAGFNQVLTVSFIGALGECSVDEAPLVMDTPFSRLSVGHRRAILSWVSEYKPQVILFTHSGEMVRETDRAYLGTSVGREYSVKRISPTSSEIVKVY